MNLKPMDLNRSINRFRLASRELFNNYFAVPLPPATWDYEYYDGFNYVEERMFQALVLDPCIVPFLSDDEYTFGLKSHPYIRVRLPEQDLDEFYGEGPLSAPILINRELDSGYWDHPLHQFDNTAILKFICFFDWEHMHSRDYTYVRVEITDWPTHKEVVGKHALVESTMVRYALHSDDGK
ncbi:MAG TPA: hypothetical protein V6C76_07565 [Drouetiella sp.]